MHEFYFFILLLLLGNSFKGIGDYFAAQTWGYNDEIERLTEKIVNLELIHKGDLPKEVNALIKIKV